MAERQDAHTTNLWSIFSENVIYRLPYFQRQFVWREPNFDQLWEDIAVNYHFLLDHTRYNHDEGELEVIRSDEEILDNASALEALTLQQTSFLGAVVLQNETSGSTKRPREDHIIDGQQRDLPLCISYCWAL